MRKRLKENEVVIIQAQDSPAENRDLDACMTNINGMLRAMHLWFHSAHNTVYGMPFAGDHTLYGKIYEEIQEEVDKFIERSIGLSGDQSMGCPIKITSVAQDMLKSLPSPTGMMGCEISEAGRDIVDAYLNLLEFAYNKLTESGLMTLGLDDLISSSASTHEGYYYLLNQRATKER